MRVPRAWLSAEAEAHVDSCSNQRQGGNDLFTSFTAVLRRSNPLVPLIITGPLHTLSTRLLGYWSTVPRDVVQFHQLKSELLVGFCFQLRDLSLFKESRVEFDRSSLEGWRFYVRPPSRKPQDSPFPYAKRDDRLEAMEIIYFLTLILSTAQVSPLVGEMPEGALAYLPYFPSPQYITAPKRRNAASLAMATRFFRLDTRPKQYQVFDFQLTVKDWEWTPDNPQASPSDRDETRFRRIAQLSANKSSRHSAVSYFVLKLLNAIKEVRVHVAFGVSRTDQVERSSGASLRLTVTQVSPQYMRISILLLH